MSRPDLIPLYLSRLEKAKFDLDAAEKSSAQAADPLDKVRWKLEAEARRSLVTVYDGLLKFFQEPGQ